MQNSSILKSLTEKLSQERVAPGDVGQFIEQVPSDYRVGF
jgi:hypothetical protein